MRRWLTHTFKVLLKKMYLPIERSSSCFIVSIWIQMYQCWSIESFSNEYIFFFNLVIRYHFAFYIGIDFGNNSIFAERSDLQIFNIKKLLYKRSSTKTPQLNIPVYIYMAVHTLPYPSEYLGIVCSASKIDYILITVDNQGRITIPILIILLAGAAIP